MPRLRCKTNPKQLHAEQEVDFEEEVAKYKRDIDKDIQALKNQEYRELQWIKDILGTEKISDNQPEQAPKSQPQTSASSSGWEKPISDTKAVQISDYIPTREEEQAYHSEEDARGVSRQATSQTTAVSSALQRNNNTQAEVTDDSKGEDISPAWEYSWDDDRHDPVPTPEENSGDFWETWLEEISQLPVSGYHTFDDLLKSPYYINQM